jgi:hypothetical protein
MAKEGCITSCVVKALTIACTASARWIVAEAIGYNLLPPTGNTINASSVVVVVVTVTAALARRQFV